MTIFSNFEKYLHNYTKITVPDCIKGPENLIKPHYICRRKSTSGSLGLGLYPPPIRPKIWAFKNYLGPFSQKRPYRI